jgi:quercetin dioxygenase-like cupin family protein
MFSSIITQYLCRTRMVAILLASGFLMPASSSGQPQPRSSGWFASESSEEYTDSSPVMSRGGRSLYFVSTQPAEGLAGHNIWVTQRAGLNHPWNEPVPLGPNVNSSFNDLAPALSRDGHLLFFASDRPGGEAALNIWVSWRAHGQDDFGWQPAVYFGPVEMNSGLASFEDSGAAPMQEMPQIMQAAMKLEPFTVRAPLDPFKIHQNPEFMVHSRAPTDLVIQRLVFAPGTGGWHTHPGPSFIFVVQGEIKLQKFTKTDGCIETPVFGPGQAYFETGNEVHRAVVVSGEDAVLLVVRFLPAGEPITTPADDPGCFEDQLFISAVADVNESAPVTQAVAGLTAQQIAPFPTARGTLGRFKVHQNPELMIHARASTDLVFQRLEFAPGTGGWHTHPGPSTTATF